MNSGYSFNCQSQNVAVLKEARKVTKVGEDRVTHTWAQGPSVHLSVAAVLTSGCLMRQATGI